MNNIMVAHHGEIVRKFIKDNHILQKDFCATIGLKPSNFGITIDQDYIPDKYRIAIAEKYKLILPVPEWKEPILYGMDLKIAEAYGGNNCEKLLAAKEQTILEMKGRLQDKDTIIDILKQQITDLKEFLRNSK